MVFKKPYAFMIKHFKLFHLILSVLIIYVVYKSYLLTKLFNNLAQNQTANTLGLSGKYIPGLIYLFIIVIILFGLFIWILMKNKNKPRKFYIFLILYFLVFMFYLFFAKSALSIVEETSMTNESLRAYRDISFLLPLPQYYFLIVSILRAIGFNVKQFNFSKDIKDLEINEGDSEEVELEVTNNLYKYIRFFRKKAREFKYYYYENKFLLTAIIVAIPIFFVIYFFVNYKFVNNNYGEKTSVSAGNYLITVNKSYVTEKNVFGNIINNDKKYIVVDLKIKNINYESVLFDTKKFRLTDGENYYYPFNPKSSDFSDLGKTYEGNLLNNQDDYYFILVYELDINKSLSGLKLKIYDSVDNKTNKAKYININLSPEKLDKDKDIINVNLGSSLGVLEEQFGSTDFSLLNYDLVSFYEYNYEVCISDNCSQKTGVINADDNIKNTLLKIEYNFSIDQNSSIYNYIQNSEQFFNKFISLFYYIDGKSKSINVSVRKNLESQNVLLIEIPKELENAESVEFVINTRNVKYVYKLK